MTLFTIGYEAARVPDVLETLRQAGVAMLVDVRAIAASRRPGFSKGALSAAVEERGIAYRHLRPLGTPKEGREAARAGKAGELARIYGAHLATEGAQHALAEAVALARNAGPICLLCYERDPALCHRTLLAREMAARTGTEIVDLTVPLGPI